MYATACLVLTATFAVPTASALAQPKPTAAEAQKKLEKLNEQVDQLVEKYNKLDEELAAARKKLAAAKRATKKEEADFAKMRSGVAQMAASAFKSGDMTDVSTMLAADDPQSVLDQAAVFTHLSNSRATQLTAYLSTAQRLQREQAQAQNAFNQVESKAKALKKQKAAVESAIKKQKALVSKLGGNSGSGGPTGGTYNGPATGSARKALDFAYAQMGKPYGYGTEGPATYDCSGLTMKSWQAGGVSLPRTTNTQYAATKRVSYENLQPGDLVFFSNLGHVGMYVGGGKMIHAPRTGKTVEVVDISSGYYRSNYYGAGRP